MNVAIGHEEHVTQDAPDYDEYAERVIDSLQQQNKDFEDEELVREEAREMADMLVLDPDTLEKRAVAAIDTLQMVGSVDVSGVGL